MNRYALEAHAREKYQRRVSDASSRTPSVATSPLFFGLLSRRVTRASEDHAEPGRLDSMTFLYELRSDLLNVDLNEVLPIN
jgi:hypothetical protein